MPPYEPVPFSAAAGLGMTRFWRAPCPSSHPARPRSYGDSAYLQQTRSINQVYVAAAVIHFLNAFQYMWVWFPLGYGPFSWVMIPEWLNVLGACLYLVSASKYNDCWDIFSDATR